MDTVIDQMGGWNMIGTLMHLDRGYTIRNFVETSWNTPPRYVITRSDGQIEIGGYFKK